jgi:type VI secretion system protein ImpL
MSEKIQLLKNATLRALGFIAWLARSLSLKKWRTQRQGAKLTEALQSSHETEAAKQLEIAILREQMNKAVHALKASGLGIRYRGKAALYALPWYVVIGASAAGKSTLLRNSNLNFPYAHGDDVTVQGFGGTRNCDWWFSDEAILLDTAGRYSTEDGDHDEWMIFLSLLKKYRPNMPVNGVIVTVSFSDLLTCEETGIDWHLKVIRHRIEELNKKLDYHLPVYLVFTKVDLIRGFEAFFSSSSEKERDQVWGISELMAIETRAFETKIQKACEQLMARLSACRMRKLAIERDPVKKQMIFDFPDQFAEALERIKSFIVALRKDNPYQKGVVLCGAYFTSGEQIDGGAQCLSLLKNHRFRFADTNGKEESRRSKGYFIKQLFEKIIFVKHDLATPSKKRVMMHRFFKGVSFGAGLMAIVAAGFLLTASLHANQQLLQQGSLVDENLSADVAYRGASLDPVVKPRDDAFMSRTQHVIPRLDRGIQANVTNEQRGIEAARTESLLSAYAFYQTLQENKANLPFHLRMGMYRGNDLLNPLAMSLSIVMQHDVFPRLAQALVQRLKMFHVRWNKADRLQRKKLYNAYYNTLKVYLMLCYPARIDAPVASQLLAHLWKNRLSKQSSAAPGDFSEEDLSGVVAVYLQALKQQNQRMPSVAFKPWRTNSLLIQSARKSLSGALSSDILFSDLTLKAAAQFSSQSINTLLPSATMFRSGKLSGQYTKTAWNKGIQKDVNQVIEDYSYGDWVIAGRLSSLNAPHVILISGERTLDRGQLARLKSALYQDYFEHYNQAWVTFLSSITLRRFHSLNDASHTLKRLGKLNGVMIRLLHLVIKNTSLSDPRATMPLRSAVKSLLESTDKQASMFHYLQSIQAMASEINGLALSPTFPKRIEQYATGLLSGRDAKNALFQSSMTTEKLLMNVANPSVAHALAPLMLSPTREAWRSIVNAAVASLTPFWKAQVFSSYQNTLQGKFPFELTGEDADLQAVSQWMAPDQGLLWRFVQAHLSPYLQLKQGRWVSKKWLGVGADFSKGFFASLTQATQMSQALFAQNNNAPGFSLAIYPYPIHGVSEITLSTSGNVYHYNNGPQRWRQITWSALHFNDDTQLSVMTAVGGNVSSQNFTGTWGFFRLLASAKLTMASKSTYQAIWRLKQSNGHRVNVRLLLKEGARSNVLSILLVPFVLPEQLIEHDDAE